MYYALKQAKKEAKLAFLLTVFYLCGWSVCAYFSPAKNGLLGFPLWFELACFYFPSTFILLTFVVIRYFFKNISLIPQTDCHQTE